VTILTECYNGQSAGNQQNNNKKKQNKSKQNPKIRINKILK